MTARHRWHATSLVQVKRLVAAAAICAAALWIPAIAGSAGASAPPDAVPSDSVPSELDESILGIEVPPAQVVSGAAVSGPLVAIPSGCAAPRSATVVFVGAMVAKDARTARFRLEQVRAGSAESYAANGLIDVRFDDDVRFLSADQRYLVGAAPLDGSLVLASKVRDSKPLFGGNAVIGVNDKTLECPTVDDPVRALHVDGSEIDSGVLNGLVGAKRQIVMAVAVPVFWAFVVVIVLVLFRWLLAAMLVAVRRAAAGERMSAMRRSVSRR